MNKMIVLLWVCAPMAFSANEIRVENGLKPEKAAVTMVFEEDLRLGADSGEDYHIWSGSSVTVDANKQGHIFITDPGGNRILQFDENGEFVKQIGQKGEGPGEFQLLTSFKMLDDQTGIAFDNIQVSVTFSKFDKSLKYVDRETQSSFGMVIQSAIFSNDARRFGSFYMIPNADGTTIKSYTGFLDMEFKKEKVLTEVTLNRFNMGKVTDPAWWGDYLSRWFKMVADGIGIFGFAEDGVVFTAVSNEYEITKWDKDLKKLMVFGRKYKPIPQNDDQIMALTEPIKDEILSMLPPPLHQYMNTNVVKRGLQIAEMPPRKPPIFWVIPMEDGGVLAIHNYDVITGKSSADIFDKKGKFIGQTELPKISVNFFGSVFGNNTKMIFKNGYAYVIEDNEDEATMVRYKYKLVAAK